jgi:capsular polysaccharide biosynthesis protein
MKTLANKLQSVFDQCIIRLMNSQDMSHKDAQNCVLTVVNEFKKPNMNGADVAELTLALQMTFLQK